MIRDVLADAIAEIDRYLEEFPEVYDGAARMEIEWVRGKMDAARRSLDAPPTAASWSEV